MQWKDVARIKAVYSIFGKSDGSGSEPQLLYLLGVWAWTSHLTSLYFGKMTMDNNTYLIGVT